MPEHIDEKHQEVTFREFFLPVWAERKRIALIAIVIAVVTLGVNFLLQPYFKSTATILPETDKSKMGSLSQFAGLASLAGVNVNGGDVARLYPVMLTSEAVLRDVILRKYATERFRDSVNLIRYFEIDEETPAKSYDKALKRVGDLMTVGIDSKTSVVTVSVEMPEPKLSADVLNAILGELDRLLREKGMSSASEQRKWIESRLVQVDGELRSAEERLKDFREKNRRITDSPQLLLEQDRLMREVTVKGTIVIELRKQMELARIDEVKQVSTINVLDEGRAPVKKERPHRGTNAAIAFLLALACASGYVGGKAIYGGKVAAYFQSLKG
jgi:uncharacterized protein involved in exopolysaccharide biosynthesis